MRREIRYPFAQAFMSLFLISVITPNLERHPLMSPKSLGEASLRPMVENNTTVERNVVGVYHPCMVTLI